jgi:RNA polymerase sigma factor (TIGR02999 family)
MKNVTQILSAIEQGDQQAAEQLLPLIYNELRKLANQKLAYEKPGQTLQATALVHEAYVRLVDGDRAQHWDSRGHFFAAAAEAMRRILVERARRKQQLKHGGGQRRRDLAEAELVGDQRMGDILSVDAALDDLAEQDARAAEVVKQRFFVGMTNDETAEAIGVSTRTVERLWVYAKAWLREALSK